MIKIFFSSLLLMITGSSLSENLDSQDALHTLFTSSQTRHQLDKLREQGKFDKKQQAPSTSIFHQPITVKMQGVVIRSDKKPVVFINDGNTLKSTRINDEIIVNTKKITNKSYKVLVRVNQQNIKLKPGQQWSESDPQVQDNFQIKPTEAKIGVTDKLFNKVDNLTVKVP